MIRTINCSFIICLFLLILGCDKYDQSYFEDRLERFMEDNRSTYSFSGKENWEIYQVFEGVRDNSFDFIFKCRDQDTLKSLGLYVFKEGNEVFIDTYIKNFPEDDFKVELVMKKDTFYCYKEKAGVKDFITGEYNYRFAHLDLVPDELNFYMVHKDSLGKIKGSNLPSLPFLSDEVADSVLNQIR